MLIDDAISVGKNVVKKEAEKTLKYKDLKTDRQHMRNVKAKVITVKTEANVTISELLRRNRNNTLRKHDNKRLQTTATLGTAQVRGLEL